MYAYFRPSAIFSKGAFLSFLVFSVNHCDKVVIFLLLLLLFIIIIIISYKNK